MSTSPPTAVRKAAIAATIGRRQQQQDTATQRVILLEDGREALLVIVADGMGGAVGGQVASTRAADAFAAHCVASAAPLAERLDAALDAANAAIEVKIEEDPSLSGMGCTIVGVVIDGTQVTWISVGDTLLLTINGGEQKRLNADHSMAALIDAAAERGEITPEEAAASDQRHLLRSALIGHPIPLIDRGSAAVPEGSRLVITTDGILSLGLKALTRLVTNAASPETAVASAIEAIDSMMIEYQDNTTIAVTTIAAPEPEITLVQPAQLAETKANKVKPKATAKKSSPIGWVIALIAVLLILAVGAWMVWPQFAGTQTNASAQPAFKLRPKPAE